MKIHLPNSAFLGNIDSFIRGFDPSDRDELEITSNPKWVSVHPMVLAMVAALGLTVSKKKIKCENLEAKSRHYLMRMGLLHLLGIETKMEMTEHESAGRFVPLRQIKSSTELTAFITELNPLLHLDPIHAEPLRYIVSELVRNVIEHSLSKNGAIVAAQYYPKTNTVKIGIADTGVGIWQTINRSHKPKNDLEAIRLALTPGITGTTNKEGGTELNAGAGLFFIKSIAYINANFFTVYSGRALYKLLKRREKRPILKADPMEDRYSSLEGLPEWPGTAVGIDMSLDTTEDFSTLLKLVNQTYREAIQKRKKSRHKNPLFI